MKDKAHADTEAGAPPEDESHEIESWLREAVHAPQAARLPNRGDVIGGKYRIEEPLGRGGMGVVFRARHVVSERPVAIKWMLRPATDEQARRRFEREARAAGRIDHPNVVALYDIGEEGDCSYLVMELLHGESLRERLKQGPLEAGEALEKLIPAMRGVGAAHRAGVVHRDLKPDNIFLCEEPEGGPREAKVLDFGISSIASKEPADSTLTQEGTLLGSLAYMSPEQLINAHDVDARADVYAFGVILYEVLTGGLPFRGPSYSALAVAIATARPERPSQIRPTLAQGLEEVVLRAIARERDARYADMNALIDALLPYRTLSSIPGADARRASLPARADQVAHPDPGRARGSKPGVGPVRLPATGGDSMTGYALPRSSRPFTWVVAGLLVVAALWVLASRLHGPDAAKPIAVSAPVTPVVPVAPSVPAAAERAAVAPAPAPTTGQQAPQPPSVAPAPAPAPAATPSAARSKAPPNAPRPRGARAAKKQTQSSEDVLFSGRK